MQRVLFKLSALGAVATLAICLVGVVSTTADILNMAWPLPFAAGVVSLLGCILFGRAETAWIRRSAIGAAASLALLSTPWSILIPFCGHWHTLPSGPHITYASNNAWASNQDPEASIAMLRETSADIIALQEIGLNARSIPQRLSDTYPHQIRCRWSVELISKRPFLDSGCLDWMNLPAAWGVIDVGGRPVTVVSVHLARPMEPNWYAQHTASLEAFVASRADRPLVLVGDFNTPENSFAMGRLERRLAPLRRVSKGHRTWPSGRVSPVPLIGIDHLWVSSQACYGNTRVEPETGSDHRAISGTIILCPAIAGAAS